MLVVLLEGSRVFEVVQLRGLCQRQPLVELHRCEAGKGCGERSGGGLAHDVRSRSRPIRPVKGNDFGGLAEFKCLKMQGRLGWPGLAGFKFFFAARPCRSIAATNPRRQKEQVQSPASSARKPAGTILLFAASFGEEGIAAAAS